MNKIIIKTILWTRCHHKLWILLCLFLVPACQVAKQKKKNEQDQKLALAIQHFEKEEYEQSIEILEMMRIDNEKVSEYLAQSLLARNGIDTFEIVKAVYALEEEGTEKEVDIIKDIMNLWPEVNDKTKADLEKAKDLFENLLPFSISQNRANLSELFFYKTIYIVYLTKETLLDLDQIQKTQALSDTIVEAYQVFKKDNLTLIESELYELIQLVDHLPPKSEKIISRYLDKVKPYWDYKKTKISINIRELGEKFLQEILRKMIDAEFAAHKKLVEKYLGYTNLSPDELKENVLDIIGGKQKPSEFILKVIKDRDSKLEDEFKDKLKDGYQEDLLKHFFEMAGK
ncbi:MAG: hypothetical protein HRU09_10435 [Oligoflexales bacterium]|nr:hypothetical protein [Oligoflexales bacterium]